MTPSCAFGDCDKFVAGGGTREACYLCWLSHQPLGWHPTDEEHWRARAMQQLRGLAPQQPTSQRKRRKR